VFRDPFDFGLWLCIVVVSLVLLWDAAKGAAG
jgi:hypothetical protein